MFGVEALHPIKCKYTCSLHVEAESRSEFLSGMDSQPVYEVAVLGAGVVGSATAYYLASRGTRPVLLLEQASACFTD